MPPLEDFPTGSIGGVEDENLCCLHLCSVYLAVADTLLPAVITDFFSSAALKHCYRMKGSLLGDMSSMSNTSIKVEIIQIQVFHAHLITQILEQMFWY